MAIKKMTLKEWRDEGKRLFGEDQMNWKFRCPVCKNVASGYDYKRLKAQPTAIGFNCIGRYIADKSKVRDAFGYIEGSAKVKQPCNYTSGGLFNLAPIDVEGESIFEFAE